MLIALYWLLSSLVGLPLTGRNLRIAWRRWRVLLRRGVRESLCLTARVNVRSDSVRLYQHVCYLALGVRFFVPSFFAPVTFGVATFDLTVLHHLPFPLAVPATLALPLTVDFVIAAFLMIPTLLNYVSQANHVDSERALHLEKQ